MASPSMLVSPENTDEINKCSPRLSDSLLADDSKRWREKVPVGIRFKPTDQVLVCHYLAGKVSGCTDGPIFPLIKQVNVYQYDPSQLSSLSYDFGDGKMYFFTPLVGKNDTNNRRVPAGGIWKKMTDSSHVKDKDGEPVATKTTVVYWKKDKKCNLVKTQWFVKEYMLLDNQLPKRDDEESSTCAAWTLCVAYYDLKRRRESERGSGDVKRTSDDLHSLASDDKQNSDDSVKTTCGNDDKC
ncbi:NAC domain protein [Melia azedarach]|uniref:NAC domain protein n=1 Tax=Melia azedarach TaxID=155640 RepID=A0ACC1XDL0_MELAZ|nr:NAC domain protein [Melia azedarach]